MSPESHMILCFASPELRKQSLEAFILYRNSGTMSCIDLPRSIVVETPKDVDKLRSIGMKTIFCLQQDSDLAYFRVDIGAIQEYVKTYDDIEHLRAEIRDFDSYDLRLRLPVVLSKLYNAINQNGGATYVHCTAGLGRAPAAARIPLEFNEEQGSWFLKRKLPEGGYEYKYIIDGGWTHNKHEPFTSPNKDGHVVGEDPNSASAAIRKRMAGDDPQLTTEELSLTISQHSAREVMLAQSGHVFLDRYVPSNQLSLDLSKMSFRTVDEPPLCPALEFCF